jgi:hypothetical protein
MRCGISAVAALVLLLENFAGADVVISESTTIDYSIPPDEGAVQIIDGAAPPTVVDVIDPAAIRVPTHVRGQSVINIRGGQSSPAIPNIATVIAYDSSIVNLLPGAVVEGNEFQLLPGATLNIHSGELIDDLRVDGGGVTNIYGGIFPDDLSARGSSIVHLFGGTIQKNGDGAGVSILGDAVFHVYLREFELQPPDPGDPQFGRLTGTLQDGSPIDVSLHVDANGGSAHFEFHQIPEPSTLAICTLGLATLAMHAGRRRSRRRQLAQEA